MTSTDTATDRPDLTEEEQQRRSEALDMFAKLRGDFDDSLEEIDNPDILDILGNGNGNSNGKGKQQQKKNKDIKEYFVYKYDRDIPLAEQIILGGESRFLQIDSEGNPITVFKIDLIKQRGFMLSPHQDGVGGLASFTLPIRFKNHKEIKDFIEVAKHETIDSIFLQHKAIWEKFVVASK